MDPTVALYHGCENLPEDGSLCTKVDEAFLASIKRYHRAKVAVPSKPPSITTPSIRSPSITTPSIKIPSIKDPLPTKAPAIKRFDQTLDSVDSFDFLPDEVEGDHEDIESDAELVFQDGMECHG
ncbi:hypothetical protein BGZ97_012836 [Linnemannia gamsii]|jgi:hypothetical protein|uniref:Uncharacterized protein n=1 Tax=Linnemannia gamsii TaxID=64522 RepID=A0A9P6ULA5_9FUNG|nr:hypothetical protein BGZ97_012836 [Linnemannia gamsii]